MNRMNRVAIQNGRSIGTSRCRGGVYLVVMAFTLLIAVISIGGVAASRAHLRLGNTDRDILHARRHAQSAIEIGRAIIKQDAGWRTNRSNGSWFSVASSSGGAIALEVVNPNGLLNNSPLDPIVMTGIGTLNGATQKTRLTLQAEKTALTCLKQLVVCAGGNISFNDATIRSFSHTIAANGNITAASGNIFSNLQASGTITGTTYSGTTESGVVPRELPAASVFASYLAEGSAIDITLLPYISGARYLDNQLISPSSNPYGPTNANGVYIIDCGGRDLVIQNSRIVGTLVILNQGGSSIVRYSVNWSPAVANYPCLLAQGYMPISIYSQVLSETTRNLNPSGSPHPYPGGTTNTDTADFYASRIEGLIYISGNAQISNNSTLGPVVVGGNLVTWNTVNFLPSATLYDTPPPGFESIRMRATAGGWRRTLD
jgi:hypothetical protein